MSAERVQGIVDEEVTTCLNQIRFRAAPLFQEQVDRLHKKYPDFNGVTFGMGTYILRFTCSIPREELQELRGMCEIVAYDWGMDDLVPKKDPKR